MSSIVLDIKDLIMENNELDYFEKKYEKLKRSVPSVTFAVRVKPIIKILVEEEAKKSGFKVSKYSNQIILNALMSTSKEDDQNSKLDGLGAVSKSYENQNGEFPSDQESVLKLLDEDRNMLSIEDLDIRDLIMKLGIRVEQLKKITTEFDQKMEKHEKLLIAIRKAELRAQEIQKLKNKYETPPG